MANFCTVDTTQFESALNDWQTKQFRYATAVALTRTAQKMVPAIQSAMKTDFDRPTAYTLNSLFVKPATKDDLTAEVRVKSPAGTGAAGARGGGVPQSIYLAPEVFGGSRQPKASDLALRNKGFLPGGMFWVPGAGAKLDQYGNMGRGQVSTIFAALAQSGTGALRASKGKGRRINKLTSQLFVGRPNGGGPLGVYMRDSSGHLKPLMIFVSQPSYRTRLPFYDIVGQVYAANFQDEFDKAIMDAIATAK